MCDVARSRLIAWIDGELEDAESAAVEEHLGRCPDCRDEASRIRALTGDIREYCAAVAGARQRPWRWAPVAAAAMVLLAAGLLWMRPRRSAPAIANAPVMALGPVARPGPRVAAPVVAAPHRVHRTAAPVATHGEPGVLVLVSVDELLPVGAAPPGAVLVGHLTFDAGGLPSSFRPQRISFETRRHP